jgi:hypothetical protein
MNEDTKRWLESYKNDIANFGNDFAREFDKIVQKTSQSKFSDLSGFVDLDKFKEESSKKQEVLRTEALNVKKQSLKVIKIIQV